MCSYLCPCPVSFAEMWTSKYTEEELNKYKRTKAPLVQNEWYENQLDDNGNIYLMFLPDSTPDKLYTEV